LELKLDNVAAGRQPIEALSAFANNNQRLNTCHPRS
jgi:hypothetical protein